MTEHEEFLALSVKVSERTATDEERARWRSLRAKLAAAPEGGRARVHARKTKKLSVRFAALGELPLSFTDEVGGGGLRLRSPRRYETGVEMLLRLEIGADQPMCARGRVVWCKREGGHFLVGLEWVGLDREQRERVEALGHAPDEDQQ